MEETYKYHIENIIDFRNYFQPAMSLIIVTYNRINELNDCLISLKSQSCTNIEVIIVNNGVSDVPVYIFKNLNSIYIKLNKNYGLNIGRNIGIAFSKAEILGFIDDDCIVDDHYVNNTLRLMENKEIYGFRGRIKFKTERIYNYLQSHYDLGNNIFSYFINTEGNSVIRKHVIKKVGGWEESIMGHGGHEGTVLSYKLVNMFGREGLVYFPDAIIYHDYSSSFINIIKKDIRHNHYSRKIYEEIKNMSEFITNYKIEKKGPSYKVDMIKYLQMKIISVARNFICNSKMLNNILKKCL